MNLLGNRQTRYAVRALNADRDHPTHQLLPANFRFGELYRHEGAMGHPSSTGWARLEKTHRAFGSRLAQQVVKNVDYDVEYGFDLTCKQISPAVVPVIRAHGYSGIPQGTPPDSSLQMTIFVKTTKDVCFGVVAAWKEQNSYRTKAGSLGKYLTETDAALFGIDMVMKDLPSILPRTGHQCAEIVTKSLPALTATQNVGLWELPIIKDIKRHIARVEEDARRVFLTRHSCNNSREGCKVADTAAQRAARQQPKEMRSVGFTFLREASHQGEVEVKGKNQQTHQRREEIGSGTLSAAQVWSCYHGRPPVEDEQSGKRSLLVVQRQQTDGCPSVA